MNDSFYKQVIVERILPIVIFFIIIAASLLYKNFPRVTQAGLSVFCAAFYTGYFEFESILLDVLVLIQSFKSTEILIHQQQCEKTGVDWCYSSSLLDALEKHVGGTRDEIAPMVFILISIAFIVLTNTIWILIWFTGLGWFLYAEQSRRIEEIKRVVSLAKKSEFDLCEAEIILIRNISGRLRRT